LLFFFFFDMAAFLDVGVNFGRVGSSRGLIALDLALALAALPRGTMAHCRFRPQSKNANSAYFSVT
jgi:hypothetical protein